MRGDKTEIIPTPQYVSWKRDNESLYQRSKKLRVLLKGTLDDQARYAARFFGNKLRELFGLETEVIEDHSSLLNLQTSDIVIFQDGNKVASDLLSTGDCKVFQTAKGHEQGYVIRSDKEGPVLLYARTGLGCLYAVTTAVQLFKRTRDGTGFPGVVIRDLPLFRYRGNNWLIWVEAGVWSYDRGDGKRAYVKRIIRKLDMSLMYKVNVILFDGMGWNGERFAGYGEMMRLINREARLRGIHLMYIGYGSGYGASGHGLYDGKAFKNRRSYPGGNVYKCMGTTAFGDECRDLSRESGTCLSNRKLMELKKRELIEFVSSVEPGAMYIHNSDVWHMYQCVALWGLRCGRCRRMWPNNDILAPDGMAGAYAFFYDSLAEAVQSVKKKSYDASRDCLLVMVSPGYTVSHATDDDWKTALKYFAAVSKFMKHKENVLLCIREQFYNQQDNDRRCIAMANSIIKDGNGHDLCVMPFCGADGYNNDQLFLSAPVLNGIYEGADMILNPSGHAFQEPYQLMNAEYSWNPGKSAFFRQRLPRTYHTFTRMFDRYKTACIRPKEIYGKDGFLEPACRKLYGDNIGNLMADMFRLKGKHNEPFIPYVWNADLGMTTFSACGGRIAWKAELKAQEIESLVCKYEELENTTRSARQILERILRHKNIEEAVRNDLEWYRESLVTGCRYTDYFKRYMQIYKSADEVMKKSRQKSGTLLKRINTLTREIETTQNELASDSRLKAIDYLGGAVMKKTKESALSFMKDNVREISRSLASGTRNVSSKKVESRWW